MVKFPEISQEVKSSWFILTYANPWKITWFVQSHSANTSEFLNFYLLVKLVPFLKTCVMSDSFIFCFGFFSPHITIFKFTFTKMIWIYDFVSFFFSMNVHLRESVHNSTYISILLFIIMIDYIKF